MNLPNIFYFLKREAGITTHDATDEEAELFDEYQRCLSQSILMEERAEKAREAMWKKVEVRLDDFDSHMRYNEEDKTIEVLNTSKHAE